MDEVLRVYEKWNTRVSTGLTNRWVAALKQIHKFPGKEGRWIKIRYLMQINVRPPTFFMYVNDARLVNRTFEKFMRNQLIKEFGFQGVPVRILIRDVRKILKQKGIESQSRGTRKVAAKIKLYKKKMSKVTHRRRVIGSASLYRWENLARINYLNLPSLLLHFLIDTQLSAWDEHVGWVRAIVDGAWFLSYAFVLFYSGAGWARWSNSRVVLLALNLFVGVMALSLFWERDRISIEPRVKIFLGLLPVFSHVD